MNNPPTEILTALKSLKRPLLHCHPNPDPDSYGSALGLAAWFRARGATPTVIAGDSPIADFAQFLPGGETVAAKSFGQINPADYDGFVILDAGAPNRVSVRDEVVFPPEWLTIIIDHHQTTQNFAKLAWIDPTYSATGEMLADLLISSGEEISSDSAASFLLGMYSDTGGFKYGSTSARTFALAAKLRERAPNYSELVFQLENNNSPTFIRFQALGFSAVEVVAGGRVALVALSHDQLVAAQVSEADTGGLTLPVILKSVRGWDLCLALYEWEPGRVKFSGRTRDAKRFDVSRLASALGGGGHAAAAGAHVAGTAAEVRAQVLKLIAEIYPELG